MKLLASLITIAPSAALLAACSTAAKGLAPDASSPVVGSFGTTVAPDGHRPNFTCATVPAPTIADDPLTLAGTVEAITMAGTLDPVDAADVVLFRAGQPIVLSRTSSDATGTFSTGAVASGGHPLDAYLKATKPQFRTTFMYPQYPFATSATLPLPVVSDSLFATLTATLGATQHDNANGALLVVVADCDGTRFPGATITVTHGSSPAGTIYDLGPIVPGADGTFLVVDVPDGKARVTASFESLPFPEHDVIVRKQDPDCPTPRATLTATTMVPGPV